MVKKSKVRLLAKALAVISLLAPAGGQALGIGEITLHSALNQNLDAEIALVLSGESVSDIKVKLAPPEKFDEAGVSWTYFLSKIKFETIARSNGLAIIKLTSTEALKEPFLDFLLEVGWPKGNLYRGFTVLVDPPSVYKQATLPVSTRTESYAQPAVATPQSQARANGQSSRGEYGPTLSTDTLWNVAERTRGRSDVSVGQMMIAIYQANPHAFYKNNVNALIAGKILKIPEREVVLKLSRNQALTAFNQHTKAWKNDLALASVDTAKKKSAQSEVDASVDNQLTLAAPVNQPEDSNKNPADQTERVKDDAEKNISVTASTDDALQRKVAELEKQLAMIQELIAIKDQQFAALQKQSQQKPVSQQLTVPSEDVVVMLEDQKKPVSQQAVESAQSLTDEVIAAKAADKSRAAVVQPVEPAAQPEPEASSLQDPYYQVAAGAGAVVLALLGWLWWRKRKVDAETNIESMFASTIMVDASDVDENISVPVVQDSLADHDNEAGTVGESSFLSEFTPSDFDSFDTDQGEIDPISEADVYLAYGRYQQAEELIRQAIKDQPDRDECKLKLLEIFYANESKTAFEAYAAELVKSGKRNETGFWEKAAEMGREICPASPLFSFADNEEHSGESLAEDNVPDIIEGGMAGSVSFAKTDDDFVKEAAEPRDDGLDFDLTLPNKTKDDGIVEEPRNNQDIDFDLSSFSMEADNAVIAADTQEDRFSETQIEELDFSSFLMDTNESDKVDQDFIGSGDLSSAIPETSTDNKQQEYESHEFDFSSDQTETKETDSLDFNALESNDSLAFNDDIDGDFDFNFDLDLPSTTKGQNFGQYEAFSAAAVPADMDELETKLDLAKAYIDMGDADAAKDLAREVLDQGTAEQKNIAQTLLDELG